MSTIPILAKEFLSQKTIAVAGVSEKKQTPANAVYQKLKAQHYSVVAVNPHLDTYDGDRCYPDLLSIPFAVDGVFVSTRPEISELIVEQCIKKNISRVWMHYSMGLHRAATTSNTSSVSLKAVARCKENNISVIAGACPLMFIEKADGFHAFLRWFLSLIGKLR